MTWGSEGMRWGSRAAAVDTVPPTIGDFEPEPGTTISSTQSIAFSLVDETGTFHALIVGVAFESESRYDVVHDGAEFGPDYRNSTRETIANGFRYTVIRRQGWTSQPRFRVIGVDGGGNTVTLE